MRKWLIFVLVVALVLVALPIQVDAQKVEQPARTGISPDAPPYGVRGPYPVGTMGLVIENKERPLPVTVWYPALNPDGLDEDITYILDYSPSVLLEFSGHALPDVAVDTTHGPYPLIIFSHELRFSRFQIPFYVEHLASYGFVVMAPDHVGATLGSEPQLDIWVNLPGDITATIDFAEAVTAPGGILEGVINTDHVAVTGHILGGWTSLAAAGAQWDFENFKTTCRDNPATMMAREICVILRNAEPTIAHEANLETVPDGLWPSLGDPRVDAVLPLMPYAVVFTFGPEGLNGVDVPAMFMAGNVGAWAPEGWLFDPDPPGLNTAKAYELVGSSDKTLVVFDQAGPWIFHAIWSDIHDLDPRADWLFSDPVWDMDHAHQLINHFATAFLLAEFYDDSEAAAALSPDAVQFAGITYETTGF